MSTVTAPPNFPDSLLKLRLGTLDPSQVPAHEALAPVQKDSSTLPELNPFVTTLLNTGYEHVTKTKWAPKGGLKTTPPSTAKVQTLSANVNNETWFMRRSIHEDAQKDGTATFAEFDAALYQNHSIKEMEYTPDLFDGRKVADWQIGTLDGWSDVVVEIYEMVHDLPSPLTHRVFSTMVARGRRSDTEFISVQSPIDLRECPAAFYSNGRNIKEGEGEKQRAPVLIGEYVSVERCAKQEDGQILWEMGLVSDAKGNLPMFVQKMSLPGQVAKDVGFVIDWVHKHRSSA